MEAKRADEEGKRKTILFNLSGHGYFDLAAYDDFLNGRLQDHEHPAEKIEEALERLPKVDAVSKGRMFRIKICGVTTAADAAHAVSCGADAVGLNFFRGSKRFVPEEAAREIVRAVGSGRGGGGLRQRVPGSGRGRFAAAWGSGGSSSTATKTAGDAARITLWRMKAVHAERTVDFEALHGYPCEAFLLDAGGAGEYGGTGRTLPWEGLGVGSGDRGSRGRAGSPGSSRGADPGKRRAGHRRREAVRGRHGVRGGIRPGRKDPEKVMAFIENAKAGFRRAEK